MSRHFTIAIVVTAGLVSGTAACAANWSLERVDYLALAPPAGVSIAEMSGVAYVGPIGGLHRFIAVEETLGELIQFDIMFTAAGSIDAVSNYSAIPISSTQDFEGIAYTNPTRNSVFLSHENGPGIREFSLANGAVLQSPAVPAVFTAPGNKRANLGFESLTRTLDGSAMWTANEQALVVDGAVATPTAGTTVRLLKLNVVGDSVASGPQYAYEVEPIHGSSPLGSPQSGLSDLVAMPDGTLLALERSVAFTTPLYLNRIYEIDRTGATDVSVGAAANGLLGQSYVPVGKTLLWSGAADGSAGQNLEGLTFGPRLADGRWVLLGVVDDGDAFSSNTLVAFVAQPIESADFDADGNVDGADFLAWQRGVGSVTGAKFAEGDADRDGGVDAADLAIWESQFASAEAAAAPEPRSALLLLIAAMLCGIRIKAGEGNRTLA